MSYQQTLSHRVRVTRKRSPALRHWVQSQTLLRRLVSRPAHAVKTSVLTVARRIVVQRMLVLAVAGWIVIKHSRLAIVGRIDVRMRLHMRMRMRMSSRHHC